MRFRSKRSAILKGRIFRRRFHISSHDGNIAFYLEKSRLLGVKCFGGFPGRSFFEHLCKHVHVQELGGGIPMQKVRFCSKRSAIPESRIRRRRSQNSSQDGNIAFYLNKSQDFDAKCLAGCPGRSFFENCFSVLPRCPPGFVVSGGP